jgi:hypothetical protein
VVEQLVLLPELLKDTTDEPGATRLGSRRPSSAGPRLLEVARPLMLAPVRG